MHKNMSRLVVAMLNWYIYLIIIGVISTVKSGDKPFTTKKQLDHVSDKSYKLYTTSEDPVKLAGASVKTTVKEWLNTGVLRLLKSCNAVNLAVTGSALQMAKRLYDFYQYVQPTTSPGIIEGKQDPLLVTTEEPHFEWNSTGLFEYDIRLHPRTRGVVFGAVKPNVQYPRYSKFKNGLWPHGVIHYTYADSIKNEASGLTLRIIEKSIELFENLTCVRFVKRNWEASYIEFVKDQGCWSTVGRTGRMQQLSIGTGCENFGVVIHEMMHGLGFWHEQSRPDRDKYVKIMYDNILDGMEKQFKIYRDRTDYIDSPYDYASIMHYGPKYFTKNGKNTIVIRDKSFKGTLGQRTNLSKLDVQQIKTMYKCSEVTNGGWGHWTSWTTCTATCGGGKSTRQRLCNYPQPRNGGNTCWGANTSMKICNTPSCVLNSDCDFENDFCRYKNIEDEGFNWIRNNKETPSGFTGPVGSRKDIDGYYIYIETSEPAMPGQKARIRSDSVPFSWREQCLVFYYHMYGMDIDTLNVYVESDGEVSLQWSLKGNQGNSWQRGKVPIRRGFGNFKIMFEAFRGGSYRGDIAIDDIVIKRRPCHIKPVNAIPDSMRKKYAEYACDFEESSPQCTWGNVKVRHDTMDWSLIQGYTPSKQTGPSADTPKAMGKSYVYLEASRPAMMGDKAWLYSTIIPRVNKYREKCFHFSYHMYGTGMGTLSVYAHDKETNRLKKIWSLSGNQGNEWRKAQIQIPHGRKLHLLMEGIRGTSYQSDMAFDNLFIDDGICAIEPPSAVAVEITQQSHVTRDEEYPPGVVSIEVISEGCGDPAVEDKNIQSQISKRLFNDRQILSSLLQSVKLVHGFKLKILNPRRKKIEKILQTNTLNESPETVKLTRHKVDDYVNNLAQLETDCNLARSLIKVNGKELEAIEKGPGHHLVALNRQGKALIRHHYNTMRNPFSLQYLINDLEALPDDSIVVIATQNTISGMPLYIQLQLRQFGARPPYVPSHKGSWAFIGYKGKSKVNWIQQDTNPEGLGPSHVSARIPINGNVIVRERNSDERKAVVIDLIEKEMRFDGNSVIDLPLHSKEIDLGKTEYTMRLCYRVSGDGTLFSKVNPALEDYDVDVKTVFIQGNSLILKLHSGPVINIPYIIKYNIWSSLVIVNRKSWKDYELSVYLDGKRQISKRYQSESDMSNSVIRIGKTVDNYPDSTFLNGSIRKMVYENRSYDKDEISKWGC